MHKSLVFVLVCSLVALIVFILHSDGESSRAIERKDGAKRVALIIGNADYPGNARLANPLNDAQDMARMLQALGFSVTLLPNSGLRGMSDAVNAFGKTLTSESIGFFYYAGHGMQVNGRNYLIPVDANLQSESDVEFECIDVGRVMGKMHDARSKLNIIVLDACRDNPFARGFRTKPPQGLAQMDAPPGSIIAYATAPGALAADGQGRNGLYTSHLLKHLPRPGVTIEQVLKEVGRGVHQDSGGVQMPWISTSYYGDFFPAGSGGQPPPPPPPPGPQLADGVPSGRTGSLKVTTTPPGAQVYLDRAPRGVTPQTMDNVQPGERVVRVELKGYQTEERIAPVQAGRTASLHIPLVREQASARLYVDTDPADATVRIMNIGPAFSQGMELKPDKYHVRVERPGYETYDNREVVLSKGEDLRLSVRLLPEPDRVSTSQAPDSKTWTDPVTGMEFVWVPGGSFEMGCGSWTSDCYDDEKPVHSVSLKGFWLGKYEVTQAQWRKVMGDNPSHFKKGGDYPVERISWDDVQKFIKALNAKGSAKFRLPSEAQWEYACRSGGKAEKYSGGSNVGRVAWYGGNSQDSTHPVGRKDPNGLGLYDMSGNVWEWVEDRWHGNYNGAPTDGSAWVSGGGASKRVYRGGSWDNNARIVRCANRYRGTPGSRDNGQGFRLLRTD